jgi:hypothetical protein
MGRRLDGRLKKAGWALHGGSGNDLRRTGLVVIQGLCRSIYLDARTAGGEEKILQC